MRTTPHLAFHLLFFSLNTHNSVSQPAHIPASSQFPILPIVHLKCPLIASTSLGRCYHDHLRQCHVSLRHEHFRLEFVFCQTLSSCPHWHLDDLCNVTVSSSFPCLKAFHRQTQVQKPSQGHRTLALQPHHHPLTVSQPSWTFLHFCFHFFFFFPSLKTFVNTGLCAWKFFLSFFFLPAFAWVISTPSPDTRI